MLKATQILSILYGTLALVGLVLLWASVGPDNTTDVIIGVTALTLGVLGVEAQSIIALLEKSREVVQ